MKQAKFSSKNGVLVGMSLILYFLVIRSLGLVELYWLRLLNGLILAAGLYYTIKKSKEELNNHIEYFQGMGLGISTGLIATALFVSFLGVYMYHIDPSFSTRLMAKLGWTMNNPEKILLATVFIEGVSSSVILSLTFMQLFKTSWNIEEK